MVDYLHCANISRLLYISIVPALPECHKIVFYLCYGCVMAVSQFTDAAPMLCFYQFACVILVLSVCYC